MYDTKDMLKEKTDMKEVHFEVPILTETRRCIDSDEEELDNDEPPYIIKRRKLF